MKNITWEMHHAEIVIVIGKDYMRTIKNRHDKIGELDLVKLLELILPYQESYIPLIASWIDKLKTYRVFE